MGECKIEKGKQASGEKPKRGDKDKDKESAGGTTGTIDVSAAEGLVKGLKFEVRGAEVEFKKITVTYESGDPEEIEVRE